MVVDSVLPGREAASLPGRLGRFEGNKWFATNIGSGTGQPVIRCHQSE